MNQAIVDRAIEALAKVGATRSPKRQVDRTTKPENTEPKSAQGEVKPCGTLLCPDCYDLEKGKMVRPPKCRERCRKWLERWNPKGSVQ